MGTTAVTRFGYGVKLTSDAAVRGLEEYDDLEFFLGENYPLLTDGWAGNAWAGETETWVLIESTTALEYDYAPIALKPENFIVPGDGAIQLAAFIEDTPLTVGSPQWVVLSSAT